MKSNNNNKQLNITPELLAAFNAYLKSGFPLRVTDVDDAVKYRAIRKEAQKAVNKKQEDAGRKFGNEEFKAAVDAEMVARNAVPWYGNRTRAEVVRVNAITRKAVKKANRSKTRKAA